MHKQREVSGHTGGSKCALIGTDLLVQGSRREHCLLRWAGVRWNGRLQERGRALSCLDMQDCTFCLRKVKQPFTCEKCWGVSCLLSTRLKCIFFPCRDFAFGLAVLTSSMRLSSLLCLWYFGLTFSPNSNSFFLFKSQYCSPKPIQMTVISR